MSTTLEKPQPASKQLERDQTSVRRNEGSTDVKEAKARTRRGRVATSTRIEPQPTNVKRSAPETHLHTHVSATKPQTANRPNLSFGNQTLEKSFVLFGFVLSVLLVLTFGVDLIAGWPFHRASMAFDITSVVCGLGLAYLSWDAFKSMRWR